MLLSIPVNLHYLLNKQFNAIMAVDVLIIVLWNSVLIILLWVCFFDSQKKPSMNIWTTQKSSFHTQTDFPYHQDSQQNCDLENAQPPSYNEVMKI